MGINKLNNALKNFELDIGITVLDEGLDSRLKTMPLYEEPLHLLLPNNNWSNENPEITWIEASSLPLCLLSKSMRERQIIDEVFAKVGFSPEPQLESNSIFQLALFVAGGQLATIVPKRFTDQPGYCSKLLTNPIITQHVGLVWPEGDPLLPMTKAMIELMTEALDKRVFDLTGDQELPKKGCHIQQLSI
jgi:DNA-binding transcriptional LysR family regulator